MMAARSLLLGCFLLTLPTFRLSAQSTTLDTPALSDLLVLPERSEPVVDRLLHEMEIAYASMDVDRWIAFFTDDVEQIDVPRRVHIVGKEAWRAQTERINGPHVRMARIHHGRARIGEWIVVEIEWAGTVRGEALGIPGQDRDYRYGGLALLELAGDKIRRQIIYGDVTTLNEQLGGRGMSPSSYQGVADVPCRTRKLHHPVPVVSRSVASMAVASDGAFHTSSGHACRGVRGASGTVPKRHAGWPKRRSGTSTDIGTSAWTKDGG